MSRNGMAGGLSSRNYKLNLSYMPDPKHVYTINFNNLGGGLNVYELDYKLKNSESPDIKNLHWKDGALGCREGQKWLLNNEDAGEVGYSAYDSLFWDYAFFHVGDEIRCADLSAEEPVYTTLCTGVPENKGVFFRYGDHLYYKNRGGYFRVKYNDVTSDDPADIFAAGGIGSEGFEPYVPITYINMEPSTHAGDSYQPENRLTTRKTVWYTPGTVSDIAYIDGDGSKTVFACGKSASTRNKLLRFGLVYIGTVLKYEGTDYTKNLTTGEITFKTAPAAGTTVVINYTYCVYDYYLPEKGADTQVIKVEVDDAVTTAYTYTPETGLLSFTQSPMLHTPIEANTVKVTYENNSTEGQKQRSSIMDCAYAIVYGGDQNLCVVMGGCPAQPNAYFWCGNNIVMDASYFPFEQYNLAGDTEEKITGFGKQQRYLVIFKEKSVGRCTMGTDTVEKQNADARVYLTMDYTPINSRIGCTYPRSIQLVGNNLVFVSREHGVCILRDSTYAYEQNIESLSKKIEGSTARPYLWHDLDEAPESVSSTYFDNNYWLTVNGHTYLWDTTLSDWKEPSWFFYTNIRAVSYVHTATTLYHINGQGSLTEFNEILYADYGEAIEKVYQFATQHMGTYVRLKDVRTAIFAFRSDTDATTQVLYDTDYERRYDLTPLINRAWRFVPRNLAHRALVVPKYAAIARRDPMCRHVKHFMMRLENNAVGEDLSVISAELQYVFQGKER